MTEPTDDRKPAEKPASDLTIIAVTLILSLMICFVVWRFTS